MITFSLISLFSAIISVIAIIIVFSIDKKVYQENYKKPWSFIGVSTLFLATSQLIKFLNGFFSFFIINSLINDLVVFILEFISVTILTYGLFLEFLILKYFKGKFVKMKFIPVQENSIGGEIDLNINVSCSYLCIKKSKKYIYEQFSKATKTGFEGFLITNENPKEIRVDNQLLKTPICWITNIEKDLNSQFLKDNLDENSDIINPLQLNNLINFIDNFYEQSTTPFILIDLDLILRTNNFSITSEFLKYIKNQNKKFNGIVLFLINEDILENNQILELKEFLNELD